MIPHSLPVQAFTTKRISCPRCAQNIFALFREKYRFVCFCLTSKCLTADKDASLAKKNGQPIPETKLKETGAEHFRLGRGFHRATMAQWIASHEEHKAVNEWTKNKKTFLLLLGKPGTGKTYLAAAMLNLLYENGEEIAYVTHRRFIEEIHFALQSGKTQHSIIPKYSDKKYLILDDLGSATCTDWQQEMILELIDRRHAEKQKTIITTNFNKEELRIKLGQRTASRLLDKENEILEFWSTDRRGVPQKDW